MTLWVAVERTLVIMTTEESIEWEPRRERKYGSTVGVVLPSSEVRAEMR